MDAKILADNDPAELHTRATAIITYYYYHYYRNTPHWHCHYNQRHISIVRTMPYRSKTTYFTTSSHRARIHCRWKKWLTQKSQCMRWMGQFLCFRVDCFANTRDVCVCTWSYANILQEHLQDCILKDIPAHCSGLVVVFLCMRLNGLASARVCLMVYF